MGVGDRDRLTPREREVLGFTLVGLSSKQIAGRLGVSPRTVAFHRANLRAKLRRQGAQALLRCPHCGGPLVETAPGA